jgi:hypothetical protein
MGIGFAETPWRPWAHEMRRRDGIKMKMRGPDEYHIEQLVKSRPNRNTVSCAIGLAELPV